MDDADPFQFGAEARSRSKKSKDQNPRSRKWESFDRKNGLPVENRMSSRDVVQDRISSAAATQVHSYNRRADESDRAEVGEPLCETSNSKIPALAKADDDGALPRTEVGEPSNAKIAVLDEDDRAVPIASKRTKNGHSSTMPSGRGDAHSPRNFSVAELDPKTTSSNSSSLRRGSGSAVARGAVKRRRSPKAQSSTVAKRSKVSAYVIDAFKRSSHFFGFYFRRMSKSMVAPMMKLAKKKQAQEKILLDTKRKTAEARRNAPIALLRLQQRISKVRRISKARVCIVQCTRWFLVRRSLSTLTWSKRSRPVCANTARARPAGSHGT